MSDLKPNELQQKCIDKIDGKLLVLAGPGTGKTFTVIERIKNIIKNGTNPERILALTFSDAAANEMKNRLDKELGKLDSGVLISTYHSFCLNIIKNHPQDFELPENYKIMSDTVKIKFLRECINEINPVAYRTKKNDPYFFIDELEKQIKEIKKYRLSKKDYDYNIEHNQDWKPELKRAEEKLLQCQQSGKKIPAYVVTDVEKAKNKLAKAEELWEIYECYKAKMEAEHYIDFEDMINFVLEKFDNDASFLKEVANEYDHLLVDEYQDTNKSQNEIIVKLAQNMESGNVFLVGDDDQLIYTFQGAKLDTMENFVTLFPETEIICLKENMRSTQSVLDYARQIAIQDKDRLEERSVFKQRGVCKELTAKNDKITKFDKPVRLYKYKNALQEMDYIIDEIEELINSDSCPKDDDGNKDLSEIAILSTSNDELESYAQMLKNRGIPYELREGKNVFSIKSALEFYYYMQLLVNPELNSDKMLKLLLLPPFSIDAKDYETLLLNLPKDGSFIKTMRELLAIKKFADCDKIRNFLSVFDDLQSYRANETLKNVVLQIGVKTGIFQHFFEAEINRNENIAGLKKLVDEAVNYSSTEGKILLEDFTQYLKMAYDGETTIKTDKAPVKYNAVQLSTYHSSKGREFAYVYMPALINEKWESSTKSYKAIIPVSPDEYKDAAQLRNIKISDKTKILYVGMTRARHSLYLSYPESIDGKTKKLSKFISEIQNNDEFKADEITAPDFDENQYWSEMTKELIKRDYDYKTEFNAVIGAKLKDKSFAPTSVNDYIGCPRKYFYEHIINLPAKDGNADAMHFGSSVHEACEKAVQYAKDHKCYPDKSLFIKYFTDKLYTYSLSSPQAYDILKGRGEKALEAFYVQLCNTPVKELYKVEEEIEFKFDGIKFKGIIDRIDKTSDGKYRIYDYKTGKAKDGSIICPDGEHEDYYNQIALYKYFFEKKENCEVITTEFIFPEEFENNYDLPLSNEDCEAVAKKFKEAIQGIKSCNFEPVEEKDRAKSIACKYCQYRDFCNLDVV